MAGLIPYRCSPPASPPPLGLDLLFITSSVSPLYYSLGLNASRRSSSRSRQVGAGKPPGQRVIAPPTDGRSSLRLRRRLCEISAARRSARRYVRRSLPLSSVKMMNVPPRLPHSAAVTWKYKLVPDRMTAGSRPIG